METQGSRAHPEGDRKRPRLLWLAVVPDIAAVAVSLLMALAMLWVSSAVHPLLQQNGEKFATHAVMAAGVSEGQAITVAERMQGMLPGLRVHVIGEAEARGLLALQEPWVRNMPEMELARLPLMVEFRHPQLLDRPELQAEIQQALEAMPEVDFSIFNDTGFENLLSFSREVKWYAEGLQKLLTAGVLVLLFLYAIRLGIAALHAPFAGLAARVVIAWVGGTILALFGMVMLKQATQAHFELPIMGLGRQMLTAGWCGVALLLGVVVPRWTRGRG